ncbi:hypothetical protein FQR65_LT19299 [Abscondita terminalis]|nr:hypothetical protein FQR65_LT19299 [Abscondita terminalis]
MPTWISLFTAYRAFSDSSIGHDKNDINCGLRKKVLLRPKKSVEKHIERAADSRVGAGRRQSVSATTRVWIRLHNVDPDARRKNRTIRSKTGTRHRQAVSRSAVSPFYDTKQNGPRARNINIQASAYSLKQMRAKGVIAPATAFKFYAARFDKGDFTLYYGQNPELL